MDFRKIIQASTDCSITTGDRFSYMQMKSYTNRLGTSGTLIFAEQRRTVCSAFQTFHLLRIKYIEQLAVRMVESQVGTAT